MNFLKKIGTPFVAVGRWIKNTAWVQPLLIVGVIFAIIFSIPSISNAIQNALATSDVAWYAVRQLSLDGTADKNSVANTFFQDYVTAENAWSSGDKETARSTMKKYGSNDRFILFFVQEDCSTCEETQEAAEYLVDNWDTLVNNDGTTYIPFAYQSIICDQEITDNDKYKDRKAFEYLYGDSNFYQFAYDAIECGTKTNYYRWGTESSTIKSNLNSLINSDSSTSTFSSNFQTPMIVEFDLRDTNKSTYIISNILYKTIGDDVYERSNFLVNLWKRKGVFSDTGKE